MNFLAVICLVIFIDQLTKYYIVSHFYLGESVPVIENVFHWTYILNSGAAFGILEGSRWIFVLIALSVITGMIIFHRELKKENLVIQFGAALFVGGAIGNLIDRILLGKVIDFFDFIIWPIFNVADIAICLGVGFILWNILMTEFADNKSK